jgi:PAS domain S-box-containing protein
MCDTTRILHIDDQPDFGDLVKTCLEREDNTFEVLTETTPNDGLERLTEETVDCIVSDYEMPEADGLEFLEAVRESFPEIPFILFTGKGSEEIASTAITKGVTDYLQKSGGLEQYEVLANRIRNSVNQHRTRRKFKRNRKFLRQILDLSPAAILVSDEQENIIRANERAETTLDLPEAEITNRSFNDTEWDIVDEDGNPLPNDLIPFKRVLETGNPVNNVEHGIQRPDGEVVWLSINAAPLWDESDSMRYVIAVLSDVTDREHQKRILQSTIRQLEGFGNILTHDLGNILQIARGRLELAQQADGEEHFEAVEESLDRAVEMLNELTTSMQAGSIVDEVSTIDVATVFNRAWTTQVTRDATKEIKEEIRIEADEMALQRMFENLIRNSFEHGVDTATVRVGSLSNGFYIEDDGPGIPEDEREKVFEPEYTTKEDGTGTGLVSIHQIALAHGWKTEITDGSDGGACFEFTNVNRSSDSE